MHRGITVGLMLSLAASSWAEPQLEAEMVVTAPRLSGPLQVVTDPTRPRQPLPAHDGADYLKTIPGFSVIRKGGTDGDPLFRGMAGSRVNVLTSDAMLLGGCGARMDPPTAYVFPRSFDRIRVLKGPQSVQWGAGGSAATVLFERDPYDHAADGSHLNASWVSGNWQRRDLAVDALAGGTAGYLRLQGSDSRSDDYEDGDGTAVSSAYRRWNGHAAAGWTPDADSLVELSLARSDGEAAYADRAMDGVGFDRDAVTLRLRRDDLTPWLRGVEARVAYGYVDHVMDNFSLRPFVPTAMMPMPMLSNPDRRTLAARLSADLALGPDIEAIVGVDAHDDEHSVRSAMGAGVDAYRSTARIDDARFRQQGLFAELKYVPAPGRTIVSGLRLDRWHVEDHRTSVRQGMALVVNDTAGADDRDWLTSGFLRYEHGLHGDAAAGAPALVLFAGLGYAERVADYWERFGNDKRGPDANSAFFTAPERTAQLDVGLVRRSANGELSLSLFANRIADYVLIDTRVPNQPMGSTVTRSVDARTFGGELAYSQRLQGGWAVDANVAYTRGYNRSDDVPLAQMPPLEARLAMTRALGRLTAGGLVRWVARQNRIDAGRGNIAGQDVAASESFTVLSLNGSYRVSRALLLSAGVDNLLDATYVEHLSRAGAMVAGFEQQSQLPEPGRTLWLELAVTL
jgi:iron complex outermembrane recepter protein